MKNKFQGRLLKNHRISLFLKLFIIWLATGLAIFALFVAIMRLQIDDKARRAVNRNLQTYFFYLAREIGSPPDTVKAKKIADSCGLRIYIENSEFKWASIREGLNHPQKFRRFSGRYMIPRWIEENDHMIEYNGAHFLFKVNHNFFFEKHHQRVLFFFGIIAVIFLGNYLLIRRVMKPVKLLEKGVRQVSQGKLEHEIPVTQNDELGDLTASFNKMIRQIQSMLQSREQLLLDVSHELRSPITRMKLALEFLSDDKTRQKIHDDLAEMETMITEILESERIKNDYGGLELSTYNLSQIIRSVAENFKGRAPGVELQSLPKSCFMSLDAERIRIVLKNILENSFKYSQPDSQPIKISLSEKENTIEIDITDDGTGIPEEHLPYLFEPFYRVDKSRSKKTGGYGLGLSLCRKIMEAHGGRIEIANNPDRGVTVKLVFEKQTEL